MPMPVRWSTVIPFSSRVNKRVRGTKILSYSGMSSITDIVVELWSIAGGITKVLPTLWFISIPWLVKNVIGC